ncbi:MAG: N-acyl-D-amino-acid deacylase family protein, partial [Acidimicrobiia bacterium]
MHDLVIRNGTIIDGSGADPRVGDIAIDGGRITAVGAVDARGQQEIDAEGLLVTPGFVDIHTHYDGQVSWDPLLAPSSWHGVTTLVMGNCGVGFAPVRPDRHEWLIGLMEGVEDIPGTALAEGITWEWESFPEYLDAIDRVPHAVDVGTQVPHGALRTYVMGERGAIREDASDDEIDEMARLTEEAVLAGALGFTTSRTKRHRAADGSYTPTLTASPRELVAIAAAMGRTGSGVFELVSDLQDLDAEFTLFREMAATSGRPLSVTINQHDSDPDLFRRLLELVEQAVDEGIDVRAQVAGRPIGVLMGIETSFHPFLFAPSWQQVAALPLADRVTRLSDPDLRERLISEAAGGFNDFHKLFPVSDPPDYEPAPESSVAAIAERDRRRPAEVAYDLMLADGGTGFLYLPLFNYSQFDLEPTREMLTHPHSLLGLSDGGAHCGAICDASVPTSMLTHWGRDRSRGPRLPLPWLVRKQTRETAEAVGLLDRGLLAPGMRADVNVIDFERLRLHKPQMVHDLPAGGRRLIQRASGYRATVVAGEVTFEDGEHTGA